MPKNTTQCPWLGLKPKPLALESSALTTRPMGLPHVCTHANFSPKALTKERIIPSSKYCIYLVCGLNMKPKFKALLSSLERDLVNPLNTTLQRTIRNNTGINYDRKGFCKNTFKRLDVIKTNKRTQSTRERTSAMYSTISKN